MPNTGKLPTTRRTCRKLWRIPSAAYEYLLSTTENLSEYMVPIQKSYQTLVPKDVPEHMASHAEHVPESMAPNTCSNTETVQIPTQEANHPLDPATRASCSQGVSHQINAGQLRTTNWTHQTCASRDQDVSHHIHAGKHLLNKLSHGPAHRGFSNRGKEIGKSLLPSGVGAAAAASPSRPGFASSETSASSICKFPDI